MIILPKRSSAFTSGGGGGGNITYVGSASDDMNSSSAATLTLPTHAADDFALIFAQQGSGATANTLSLTTATGWTQLDNWRHSPTGDAGDRVQLAVWYKKLTSASETAPVITSDKINFGWAHMVIFRGVDTVNPFDTTYSRASHFVSTLDDVTPTPASIVTANAGSCVVVWLAEDDVAISAAGAPSGYTTAVSQVGSGSNRDFVTVYNLDVGAAGTISPGAYTNTGTDLGAITTTITFALRSS